MELLKTEKRGRPDNNKKHEGKYFLSIRKTRGTMTDATADFLGVEEEAMIAFFKEGDKNYIHVAEPGEDTAHHKKLSKVNGRWGVYTKHLVSSKQLKEGGYEVLPNTDDPKMDGWYELSPLPVKKQTTKK